MERLIVDVCIPMQAKVDFMYEGPFSSIANHSSPPLLPYKPVVRGICSNRLDSQPAHHPVEDMGVKWVGGPGWLDILMAVLSKPEMAFIQQKANRNIKIDF